MIEPYASCPCGSGKKFKWCCQLIYAGIQQAEDLYHADQHETALKTINQVCEKHPDQPHAWGKKAEMLARLGQIDACEEALEKAFSLNSSYGFGLMLRARIRFNEGEVAGGLLLARKAADAYSLEAKEDLSQLQRLIFQAEWHFRRPVAARAALEQALALEPTDEEARQILEGLFGPEGGQPEAARRRYSLLTPPESRRRVYTSAFASTEPRLTSMASAYAALAQHDAGDATAWYNLAICRAWLGDNKAALEALEPYIEKAEKDEDAAAAAALGEVLRCGAGMDDQCDYAQHAILYQVRDLHPVQALLQEWLESKRLIPRQSNEEGELNALILELSTSGLVTVGGAAADTGRLAGELRIQGPMFQVHCPVEDTYNRLKEELRTKLRLSLTDLKTARVPPSFPTILAEAVLLFGKPPDSEEVARQRMADHASRFFEDTWIKRPRKSLSNIAPVDAAGSARLRRKLAGIIDFHQQCAAISAQNLYDFDQLRRKLGLVSAPAAPAGTVGDITAMGAAELSALKPESLADEQLEQAYQAAYRLDAQELAGHFAQAMVARPTQPGKADRFPYVSFLVTKALAEGDTDAALSLIDEGTRIDCESNEGRRRDDYELRRANVHVKRGEAEQAEDVFGRLIQRSPRNFKVRGQAAEAMLQLKQPAKARKFAEEGAAEARKANDRDADNYLNDLASAAKRQGG
jgi:tetratricopeptide (TPR) repeat protein